MQVNDGVINEPAATTIEIDNFEDELKKLNSNNNSDNNIKQIEYKNKCEKIRSMSCKDMLFYILFLIIIISSISLIYSIIYLVVPFFNEQNNIDEIEEIYEERDASKDKEENPQYNDLINDYMQGNRKLNIAFVYSTLYANGIARFIQNAANYFVQTGRYNVYIITERSSKLDYKIDNRIHHIVEGNRTLLKNKTKDLNIDFFILQNTSIRSTIRFFKELGKFVIGMFHGLYVSAMFHGKINPYKNWISFDGLDAYIFIGYDDYFFYKKLGFQNEIFIPNFYTFEPNLSIQSELKTNNIVMLGRAADEIKGIIYAIKSMSLIVKEIPDAKLILLSSSSNIEHLKNYSRTLNVYNNIKFNYYTENISQVFWNSSVLMYTSLSEAFPLAMIEGKAHGLPVVAFDVACSPPYQTGVINVDMLDCEALANETVKLLKDYDYRRKMGKEAKISLGQFNNADTEKLWEKLFVSLLKGKKYFRELQKEVEEKYYDENKARIRMEKRFRDVNRLFTNFSCYTLNNFADINYVRNIQPCPNNNNTDNQK